MERVKITQVRPNPNNPRTIKGHKFDKLVKSIKGFPEMLDLRPIVVNDEMIVLGGNMRLRACQEAGLTEVPIIKASNLTEDQEKEFIIKDNSSFGEWDWDALANEWDTEELLDWGMDFPEDWAQLDEEEATDDNYEPTEQTEMYVKQGDLITFHKADEELHRLICDDSTSHDVVERLTGEKYYDLVVTDPPYNVDYEGSNGLKIQNDKMGDDDFLKFLQGFYDANALKTKKGGGWYVFHADSASNAFRLGWQRSGLLLKQCLIWVKNSIVLGRQDYQWKHEPILYGWKEGAGHYFTNDRTNPTVIEQEVDFSKMKKDELVKLLEQVNEQPSTIIHHDKPSKNDVHPTMKPIPLVGDLIKNSSRRGEIVGDPFSGSGSTMVACHQLGRKCYGIELDPKYCQVIIERMQQLDEHITIKINGEQV